MVFHFYTTSTCVTPYKCPSPSILFNFICIIFLFGINDNFNCIYTYDNKGMYPALSEEEHVFPMPAILYQSSCKVIHN